MNKRKNIPEYFLGGSLKKLIPSAAGVAASFIPGVGPALAPLASKVAGTAIQGNKTNKTNSNLNYSSTSYGMAQGGAINWMGQNAFSFTGPSHEDGGIQIPNAEVEGGETMDFIEFRNGEIVNKETGEPYVFSKRLQVPGTNTSFAKYHKKLVKDGANEDQIRNLAQVQEEVSGRKQGSATNIPTMNTSDRKASPAQSTGDNRVESAGTTGDHRYEKRDGGKINYQTGGPIPDSLTRVPAYGHAKKYHSDETPRPSLPLRNSSLIGENQNSQNINLPNSPLREEFSNPEPSFNILPEYPGVGPLAEEGQQNPEEQSAKTRNQARPQKNRSTEVGDVPDANTSSKSTNTLSIPSVSEADPTGVGISSPSQDADLSQMSVQNTNSVSPEGEEGGLSQGAQSALQFVPDILNFATGAFGDADTPPPTRVSNRSVDQFETDVNVNPQLLRNAANYRAILADPNASTTEKLAAQSQKQQADAQVFADKINRESRLRSNKSRLQANLDRANAQFANRARSEEMKADAMFGPTGNIARGAVSSASQKLLQQQAQRNQQKQNQTAAMSIISQLDPALQEKFIKQLGLFN